MEERTVNIMLNATAELNRKENEDLYIPVRASEYRDLIRSFYEADAAREKAETRAINYGSESYRQGERIKEMLKQPQYKPMPVERQVVIIYAATKKYLLDIAVDRVADFEKELFEFIDTKYPEIFTKIREEKKLSEELEAAIIKAITEFKAEFK